MPIHRTIKNVVKNYTVAEVKVREATSNDPWGPSTSLMTEIADLTFNMMALAEIMNMIWKRLNDSGKNWRHVYKSLVLLDYLLKTGSERVAQQARENVHSIHSLKDFQHFEDGKDHGASIREKSKQITAMLRDEERFKNERTKALTAKERFAQNTGMGSGVRKDSASKMSHSTSDRYLYASSSRAGGAPLNSELEAVRPSSFGEEDLQLQLALAMSKEEHEEEQKRRKGDEMKLQMAIEESKKITGTQAGSGGGAVGGDDDLVTLEYVMAPMKIAPSQTWDGHLSAAAADPWVAPVGFRPVPVPSDPWGLPAPVGQPEKAPGLGGPPDPWSTAPVASAAAEPPKNTFASPWGEPPPTIHAGFSSANSTAAAPVIMEDEFDLLSTRYKAPTSAATNASAAGITTQSGNMNFDLLGGDDPWDVTDNTKSFENKNEKKKTAEEFLGPNANLVNLNDLVTPKPPPSTILNPFGAPTGLSAQPPAASLFAARAQQEKPKSVPINQLQGQVTVAPGYAQPPSFASASMSAPLQPLTGWSMASGSAPYQQPLMMQPQAAYPSSKNPFQ